MAIEEKILFEECNRVVIEQKMLKGHNDYQREKMFNKPNR